MDASKITELNQKMNTKYINRSKPVDSSTLIWKNQIQSSRYIKGVKTCNGEQNCNAPTISSESTICSFGGAGRTTSIQMGSTKQVLSVYSGASGSTVHSSDAILLQKAGNESCQNSVNSITEIPCNCSNTNINTNPYLPPFDTYYNMKHPCVPTKDKNQKHCVKECHTRFLDNNGVNGVFNPSDNVTTFDSNTKEFHTTNTNPPTCDGYILEPVL